MMDEQLWEVQLVMSGELCGGPIGAWPQVWEWLTGYLSAGPPPEGIVLRPYGGSKTTA